MKLVHWPLIGGLLHLVQRGGAWADCGSAQSPPRCTKCNNPPINCQCTNQSLYDGPLLCGFNVAIKGLITRHQMHHLQGSAIPAAHVQLKSFFFCCVLKPYIEFDATPTALCCTYYVSKQKFVSKITANCF